MENFNTSPARRTVAGGMPAMSKRALTLSTTEASASAGRP